MSANDTTAVQVVQPTAVVRSPEAATLDRLQAVRATLAPDLTDGELELFAMVAVRSGLDPFAKQIYAVKRSSRQGPRMTIQTGIDGYRSIAARTGEYDGQDEPIYGPDCACGAGSRHPESATVRVYRKGMSRAVAATAFWHEYVPTDAFMWSKMPHVMIAKVAEALALRKAFPWDPTRGIGIGSDVYTTEEMAQAENVAPPSPSLVERIGARAEADGISVADFAEAVANLDPADIRRVRDEMYPQAGSVSVLQGWERKALRDRLLQPRSVEASQEANAAPGADETPVEAEDGEYREVQAEPEGEPFPPGEVRAVEEVQEPQIVACEAPSPYGDGAVCLHAKGHRGSHRASPSEAWPR